MSANLLNPGCGPCNSCCQQCSDYYPPNDWYLWLEGFLPSPHSISSPGVAGSGTYSNCQMYWTAADLHDVLNSFLATFTWPLTEPSATIGSDKKYVFPAMFFSSVVAYGTVHMRHETAPGPTWSSWVSRDIEFSNFAISGGYILNNCVTNERSVRFDVEFEILDVFLGTTQDGKISFEVTAPVSCATKPLVSTDRVIIERVPATAYRGTLFAYYEPFVAFAVPYPVEEDPYPGPVFGGPDRDYIGQGFLDTAPP